MNELITVSRRYGSNPDYVVAGGGNTSWKTGDDLYVKGSGFALETIAEGGFVRMNRQKLSAIWTAAYPELTSARETAVLAALMDARQKGEEEKRPSVETLLHDALPSAFVVHTHPALVNGLTCSIQGEKAAKEIFGDDALWIPSTNPGYILSKTVKDAYSSHTLRTGCTPSFILLQNHGIFVASDTVAGIDAVYERIMDALSSRVARKADFSPVKPSVAASETASEAVRILGQLATAGTLPAAVSFASDAETSRLVASRNAFSAVAAPFTPDHIVYAGSAFLFAEDVSSLEKEFASFKKTHDRAPKLAAVRNLGVFGIGSAGNEKSARLAVELFRDAVKISVYTESFGGPRYMTKEQIDFINNWEVEQYRTKISTSGK